MLSSIISEINAIKSLPVAVEAIAKIIINKNLAERIYFVPTSSVPAGGMCGAFERRDVEIGWGKLDIVTITYNANEHIHQQRLTCFKELVHIFDSVFEQTDTAEEINALVEELATPDGVSLANIMVLKDRLAEYLCLPMAVPAPLLEELRNKKRQADLTVEQIVEIVALPEQYVKLMLSEEWDGIAKLLAAVCFSSKN